MNKCKIIHFSDPTLFGQLEDQAIDGLLEYDDFPPEEYRYFSKLSKLGYYNRHKGWTREVCELKQKELLQEYREAVTVRSERAAHMKRLNDQLICAGKLSLRLNKTTDREQALRISLQLNEQLMNEPGLARRIRNNIGG